jgi:serine phosphatase RsbU (regulator of sigma subunit)/CHASE3 domain sensor protein
VNVDSLPLRRRLFFGFVGAVGLISILTLVVGLQYLLSFNGALKLQQRLTPATELADSLMTAQSSASGDLSDYVLTGRQRALDAHIASLEYADSLIRALEATLEGDAELIGRLAGVRAAQQVWVDNDVTPTLALMEEGDTSAAARSTNRPRAWESFDDMLATTTDFRDTIEGLRDEVRSSTNAFTRQLGLWLVFLAAVLLAVMGASFVVVNSWVIQPLLGIRKDLEKAAANDHTHPIDPVGPPELQAVATDAENLRRSLVSEIDEVRAARTGLAQGAPLAAELEAAFSQPELPQIAGLSIAGTSRTAEGVVSGDWWDMFVLPDGRLAVVIGDTSGHGTGATLTALRTRDLIRACLRAGDTPLRAVQVAGSSFDEDDNFVTAFVAALDPIAGSLEYVNAGHQPAVIVTAGKEVTLCTRTGPLLTALGGDWSQQTVSFKASDLLLAFTDGLIEGHGPDGVDLDPDALARMIKAMDGPVRKDASEVLARVVAQVRERAGNWYRDDMTVVTVGHVGMAL